MRKIVRYIMFAVICLGCMFVTGEQAKAENQTVTVKANEEKEVELKVGGTGCIVPDTSTVQETQENWYDDYLYETAQPPVRFTFEFADWSWNPDDHCMTLDENGNFAATAPGTETVEITGYDSYGTASFYATVYFTIRLDMSHVTLAKKSLKGYLFAAYNYGDYVCYNNVNFEIPVNSSVVLDENMEGIDFSCESSNTDVSAYASLQNNTLYLEMYAQEKCSTVLTINIGGKSFQVSVKLQPVQLSCTTYLLEKGHTKQLKLKGYSGKITWSSTNSKVASVSRSGLVKGKQIGNVVITAKVGDQRIGCAVSVTTSALKKVCARATYIGKNWTYSQPKRAQNGYYDCSSLVWKAYRQYTNISFGSSSYPGTSATEAAWCRDNKKLIKGGYSYKKVQKMQLNPGDIVIKSENLKKPYSTTYHVEMFTGYICVGYDSNGKPIVESIWASRGIGYGAEEGSLLARPTK